MTKQIQSRNLGDTTSATRKITSGATTIKSSAGVLQSIIISDPGQKCIVAIKDGTSTKMLFTMQQNTEQSGSLPQVIECGFDCATSIIAEMYVLDPILFLNFNNTSTTTVEDLSGSNIDGTMTNMEAADRHEDAEIGKALNFSGTDEYITFGDNFDWDPTSEARTFCFWIKMTTGAGGYILSKWNAGYTVGWGISPVSDKIRLYIDDLSGQISVVCDTAIVTNTWTHVAITYDGSGDASGVTMYLNGAVAADTDGLDTLTATVANAISCVMGACNGGDAYHWTGVLDEVMIFERELSATEVEFIARNGYGYGATDGARLGDITLVFD